METKDADGQGDGDEDGDEAEDGDEVDGDRRDEAKVEVGDEVLCARLPQSAGNTPHWGEVRVAGRQGGRGLNTILGTESRTLFLSVSHSHNDNAACL